MTSTLTTAGAAAKPFTDAEREDFFRHYVVAALWSSTDEAGSPLDDQADPDDLTDVCAEQMRSDCNDFIDANLVTLRGCGLAVEQLGHDFWLTRNGHGAGYWDRGIGKAGELLSQAAKVYGSFDLFIDAEGKVSSMAG